jgi:hypothetical protein
LEQAHTVGVIGRYAEMLGKVFAGSAAPAPGHKLLVANHGFNPV